MRYNFCSICALALALMWCAGCQVDLDETAYEFACDEDSDCAGSNVCRVAGDSEPDSGVKTCQPPGDAGSDAGDEDVVDDAVDAPEDVDDADSGDQDTCTETNGGVEICDDVDNDCNGEIDDGLEFQARSLAAADGHVCAVTADNEVYCWGANDAGQTAPESGASLDQVRRPRKIAEISATAQLHSVALGDGHSCAVEGESTIRCWGDNTRSQLGPDAGTSGSINEWTASYEISRLQAGDEFSCTQSATNKVFCWGYAELNRMGATQGSSELAEPTQVMAVQESHSGFLALGLNHGCLLDIPGIGESSTTEVRCWGGNVDGKAGVDGDSTIEPTTLLSDFTSDDPNALGLLSMALGGTFSCGLNIDELLCWGSNLQGELAQPETLDATHEPRRIELPSGSPVDPYASPSFATLAAGKRHACAIDTDGNLFCWGDGSSGQIGDGASSDRFEPTSPSGDRTYAFVAAGNGFTCAIESYAEADGEGTVYCWGKNENHQLGLGVSSDTPASESTPRPVACSMSSDGT